MNNEEATCTIIDGSTTKHVAQLVRGCASLTKISGSRLENAAVLKLGWESFAAFVVLPGSNPD